jgi:quinol monooxygenase YgiN
VSRQERGGAGIGFAAAPPIVRLSVHLHAPEAQARAIKDALRMLMRGTRLEPGCTGCEVWTSAEGAGELAELHYEERWGSERAIENRVRSDAFTKLLEVLEAASDKPRVNEAATPLLRRVGIALFPIMMSGCSTRDVVVCGRGNGRTNKAKGKRQKAEREVL